MSKTSVKVDNAETLITHKNPITQAHFAEQDQEDAESCAKRGPVRQNELENRK